MFRLDTVAARLARHRPREIHDPSRPRAAVAVILREGHREAELLLIERAEREGDPWSGHMAFPGGRMDPGDPSPRAAAQRETEEEVGLSLAAARELGQLDDLEGRHQGRRLPLVISAFVFALDDATPPLRLNHEVRSAFWVPLGVLLDPRHETDYLWRFGGRELRLPGVRVGDPKRHVVWGLTYRFLEIFFDALGCPLPRRYPEELLAAERSGEQP